MVDRLQPHMKLDHIASKLVLKKVASCSTKVAQCSILIAPYNTKIDIKKNSLKHTHAGSSFQNLVAIYPTMKTDLNSDVV